MTIGDIANHLAKITKLLPYILHRVANLGAHFDLTPHQLWCDLIWHFRFTLTQQRIRRVVGEVHRFGVDEKVLLLDPDGHILKRISVH